VIKKDMPVATSATSSVQMMHQSQSGSAVSAPGRSSIPPNGKKKCPPSPTPNFNARSLPKGKFCLPFHRFKNVTIGQRNVAYKKQCTKK
jgi:hypothetical protein